VNGGDFPVGCGFFLGLCFVFLYRSMIKMKVDEKKENAAETDGWR